MQARREAAEALAAKLFDAEVTINNAITKAAELVAAMPTACMQAGLTAAYGQAAVAEAVGAVAALSQARERIGASHEKLGAIQRRIGLGALAVGSTQEKPPEVPKPSGLRLIDEDVAA